MANLIATIREATLSDGSQVTDVWLRSADHISVLQFSTTNHRDAENFAQGLKDLIEMHTDDSLEIKAD